MSRENRPPCFEERYICPLCKRGVEIFNDDLEFSLEVHMQFHKSLLNINQDSGHSQDYNNRTNSDSSFTCPDCKENVEIFNNDISLTHQLHKQTHKSNVDVSKYLCISNSIQCNSYSDISKANPESDFNFEEEYSYFKEFSRNKYGTLVELPSLKIGTNVENTNSFSNGEDFVLCSPCNSSVSKNKWKEHTEGIKHLILLMKFNLSLEGNICETCNDKNCISKDKKIMDKMMSKYFNSIVVPKNEHYFCKLCEVTIYTSYNEDVFKQNILDHINGQRHVKKCKKIVENSICKLQEQHNSLNSIFIKLLINNSIIRKNKAFLENQNDNFYCRLCSCLIPISLKKELLSKSLLLHLTGSKHVKNAKLK